MLAAVELDGNGFRCMYEREQQQQQQQQQYVSPACVLLFQCQRMTRVSCPRARLLALVRDGRHHHHHHIPFDLSSHDAQQLEQISIAGTGEWG
jgi:hypothetical protein